MHTRRPVRRIALLIGLAAAFTAPACATTGGGGGAGTVSIQVTNDLQPPTAVTIYAERTDGAASRRLIGNVEPSATRTLTYDPGVASGQYVLIARPTAGDEVVSNPFIVSAPTSIRWSLSSNVLVTQE